MTEATETPKKNGRFVKGKSGNPNGRPRKVRRFRQDTSGSNLPAHLQRSIHFDPVGELRPGAFSAIDDIARQFVNQVLAERSDVDRMRLRCGLANAMEAAASGKLTWDEFEQLPNCPDGGFIPWGWSCEWDRANSADPHVRAAYQAELRAELASPSDEAQHARDIAARAALGRDEELMP